MHNLWILLIALGCLSLFLLDITDKIDLSGRFFRIPMMLIIPQFLLLWWFLIIDGRERFRAFAARADHNVCATRYPIIMVHGSGFRDLRYFNYWGRIPKELTRNGAAVYYGH